jgi:hypothetical protein
MQQKLYDSVEQHCRQQVPSTSGDDGAVVTAFIDMITMPHAQPTSPTTVTGDDINIEQLEAEVKAVRMKLYDVMHEANRIQWYMLASDVDE